MTAAAAEGVEREKKRAEGQMVKPARDSGYVVVEHMKALLEAGAKVDVVDMNGQMPLHALCSQPEHCDKEDKSQREACRLLLDHGAKINQQDDFKMTPVAYAALNNNLPIISELINRNANVSLVDENGQSPLMHSAQSSVVSESGESSHREVAKALLDHSRENIDCADQDGNTALSLAVGAGDIQLVELLLQYGANAKVKNKDGDTALHRIRDVEMAELFIQKGVKVDAANNKGNTILHIAADNHNFELLKSINTKAVNARNHLGRTPLHNVVSRAVHICQANVRAEDGENSSQYMAVTESRFRKLIHLLIQKGADINIKDQKGESPIMLAVTNPALLKIIISEFKADIKTTNSMGRGLFHVLVEKYFYGPISPLSFSSKTIEVINLLQANHLDINMVDIWNGTALHVAVSSKFEFKDLDYMRSDLVQSLLDHGCDVAVRDNFGYLPIHYAIKHNDVFGKLWGPSLQHFTDLDFNNLRTLVHLNDINKGQCQQLKQMPVNFNRPTEWCCTQDFKICYRTFSNHSIRLQSFDDLYQQWLKSLQSFTYVDHQRIVKTLTSFVKRALAAVSRINPLVACEFRLNGSEAEKTKVIRTDEMDALSILTFITFDKFFPPEGPCHNILQEFVKLECRPEYREELAHVLDDNYCLSRGKLYQHYSTALSEALADPQLWKDFPTLQRITNHDIVAGNRTITPMKVHWHDDVYPYLLVDVDMVPAIKITGDWWPDWASTHPLLKEHEVLVVPKWKTSAVEDDCMMEVGISHWSKAFDEMPEEMKQGYRLAKVMKELCPKIANDKDHNVGNFLTSYMLKMIVVRLYADNYLDTSDQEPKTSNQEPKPKDARQWAVEIYEKMEEALEKQKLPSFFIPDYDLLYDKKFDENKKKLAIAYSKLCQKMLTEDTTRHFYAAYMGL